MRAAGWPTVGRGAQLEVLTDALAAAAEGAGTVVTVEAAAGAGKTRLLDEAHAAAEAAGFTVLRARAPAAGVSAPFAAPLAALGRTLADLGGGEGTPRSLIEAAAGHTAPPVAVERLLALVDEAAARGPSLLVLDDLHRADGGTVAWVEQLVPRVPPLPLVVVLAARPPDPGAPMERVWPEVRAASTTVALPALTEDDVVALARSALGGAPGDRLRSVLAATGSVPLLVTAVLETLSEAGVVAERAGGPVEVDEDTARRMTARAPEAVVERVREITAPGRRPLLAAAVLGDPFAPVLVARVLGEGLGEVIEALERAERSGLVVAEGQRFRFGHDLYRQAVLASASGPVLAALHGEAARVTAAAGERPLVVAEHLLASGLGGDEAVDWLAAAAESVVAYEPTTALTLVEQALSWAPQPSRRLTTIHLRALASVGRVAESEALARRMLATASTPAEEVGLRRELAMTLFHQGRSAECLTEMRAAAELVPPGPARTRLEGETSFAQLLTGDFGGAGERAEQTIEAASAAGDLTSQVAAEMVLCLVRLYDDRRAEALVLADSLEHLAALPQTSDAQLYQPWFAASLARLEVDDLDGARRAAAEGHRRSTSAGYAWMVPAYDALRAFASLRAGELDDCVASAEAALAWNIEDRLGAALWCRAFLARAAGHRGDLDVAREHAAAGDALVAAGRAQLGWDHLAMAHAGIAEREGEPERALVALGLVWDLHEALGAYSALQELGPAIVRLAALTGQRDRVDAVVARAGDVHGRVASATSAADVEWARAWRDGDPDALRRAIAHQERTPRRLVVATQRAHLAQLLEGVGDRVASADVARQAAAELTACGATADAAALAPLAGRHGRAAVAADHLAPLSRRERRVVAMIAEGLTNGEIAEALVVSRRTVESHVSAAYRKLGVGNRVELARLGMRLDA